MPGRSLASRGYPEAENMVGAFYAMVKPAPNACPHDPPAIGMSLVVTGIVVYGIPDFDSFGEDDRVTGIPVEPCEYRQGAWR